MTPSEEDFKTAIRVLRWYADELGGNETRPLSDAMELVDFIADRLQVRHDGLESAVMGGCEDFGEN
mgnify:CR=1 FL=1